MLTEHFIFKIIFDIHLKCDFYAVWDIINIHIRPNNLDNLKRDDKPLVIYCVHAVIESTFSTENNSIVQIFFFSKISSLPYNQIFNVFYTEFTI